MMTFDSNRAWQQATVAIRANREVLFALSGVFFLLPSLAFSLLFPQPTPPAGMDEQAAASFAIQYYSAVFPFALPVAILQAAGTLALLTLLTDRNRPTVRDAIRTGFIALVPYLFSQILVVLGCGLTGGLLLTVLGLVGGKAVAGVGLAALFAGMVYIYTRTSLTAPVVAVDGVRNPIAALSRSWALTRGNAGRILVFYALVLLAFLIVLMVITTLTGLVLTLVLPAKLATILSAVISSALGAAMALTFVAIVAAVHGQLSGERPEAVGAAFD